MSQKFNVGDEVEFTIKGKVYEYPSESLNDKVSPNHVAVSTNGFIHHLHRSSKELVKIAPSRPDVELGQVWVAGTDQGNRHFLVYVDNRATGGDVLLVGTNGKKSGYQGGDLKMLYTPEEFFTEYPGASLSLNADGSTVADGPF